MKELIKLKRIIKNERNYRNSCISPKNRNPHWYQNCKLWPTSFRSHFFSTRESFLFRHSSDSNFLCLLSCEIGSVKCHFQSAWLKCSLFNCLLLQVKIQQKAHFNANTMIAYTNIYFLLLFWFTRAELNTFRVQIDTAYEHCISDSHRIVCTRIFDAYVDMHDHYDFDIKFCANAHQFPNVRSRRRRCRLNAYKKTRERIEKRNQ